ncbi:GNAT family N-acetyltransferase [Herbidospora galbida]|uniref:GNAT family N-acetyltransferase n=1 Tax=Herbidospora galbida TaxID=2575442 RepID=A0A4U3M9C7_9ACTN|nr:GNAT family N-acetyltransferase [Herbidospora galbida]TKK85668.1 GNAT family N-acetyltransferase [Herbidospora galbida]
MLEIRPLRGRHELDLFRRFPSSLNDGLEADLDAGRRRLDWLWLALRDGEPVARVAWWRRDAVEDPLVMDVFDLATEDDGRALLDAAMPHVVTGAPPPFVRFVPADWRDHDTTWLDTLRKAGATPLVERLRLEWRPGTPIAPTTLEFREPAGRDELVGLMAQVVEGSLDAHTQADLTRMTPREQAESQYDHELALYDSPREWWRVGLVDGEPAGFVIPARNPTNAIIAYIGVLPAHRGKGLVGELLAEGTRILAGNDVPRIRANTDVTNAPMARAFARAGYVTIEHQVDMVWEHSM